MGAADGPVLEMDQVEEASSEMERCRKKAVNLMRDRLIRMLFGVKCEGADRREGGCTHRVDDECVRIKRLEACQIEKIADYLLANGVIVLPCKPGTEIYFAGIESGEILKGELIKFSFEEDHIWFNCKYGRWLAYWHLIEDFGVRVFLTREEAEQALKGESHEHD